MVRITAYILLFLFLFSCQHGKKEKNPELNDLESIKKKGELTVLTLYSSTSYFLYRGEEMGYEYELIKQFAESEGLKTKIVVAENIGKLVEMRLRRVWTVRTSSEKSPSRSVTPGNDPPRLGESGAPVTKLMSLP